MSTGWREWLSLTGVVALLAVPFWLRWQYGDADDDLPTAVWVVLGGAAAFWVVVGVQALRRPTRPPVDGWSGGWAVAVLGPVVAIGMGLWGLFVDGEPGWSALLVVGGVVAAVLVAVYLGKPVDPGRHGGS